MSSDAKRTAALCALLKLVTAMTRPFLGGSTMRWTTKISVCFVAHSKHEAAKMSLLTSLCLTVRPSVRT